LLLPRTATALTELYFIDPLQSFVTIAAGSGATLDFGGGPIELPFGTQVGNIAGVSGNVLPGIGLSDGLTTSLSGQIQVDYNPNFNIRFFQGSTFVLLDDSGSWAPGDPGAVAPAQGGVAFGGPLNIVGAAALRDAAFNFGTGPQSLTNLGGGAFSYSGISSISVIEGAFDYDTNLFGQGGRGFLDEATVFFSLQPGRIEDLGGGINKITQREQSDLDLHLRDRRGPAHRADLCRHDAAAGRLLLLERRRSDSVEYPRSRDRAGGRRRRGNLRPARLRDLPRRRRDRNRAAFDAIHDSEAPARRRLVRHPGRDEQRCFGAWESSHLPTGGGDCNASAPFCVTGPFLTTARCSDGAENTQCAGSFHCADATCIEYFPGLGICQDGSATDACLADADCDAGCDCVNFGGALGSCVGGCAPPGGEGAYCTTAADCASPLGCVDFVVQSICFQCSLDAECSAGETCQGGLCLPGS
jgi:hypothetical protein